MHQTRYGEQRISCVYTVWNIEYPPRCMYVGQSKKGVRLRLWTHVREETMLGGYVSRVWHHEAQAQEPILDYLRCTIVVIDGDLNEAERWYIRRLGPVLNAMLYENCPLVEPTRIVSLHKLYVQYTEVPMWRRQGPDAGDMSAYTFNRHHPPPASFLEAFGPAEHKVKKWTIEEETRRD